MMYTKSLGRLVRAFSRSFTLCVVDCECGRTHFVSGLGHGDYEDGELERLQSLAKENPGQYIEEPHYDQIDVLDIQGIQFVPDCPCGKADQYAKFLEDEAEQIAEFVASFLADKKKDTEFTAAETAKHIEALKRAKANAPAEDGWQPIATGPRDLTNVQIRDASGKLYEDAHWASDRSGEDQPPFEGWFVSSGSGFRQIDRPEYWRPIQKMVST